MTIAIKKVINPKIEIDYITKWIRNYFLNNGPHSKAVIGISGGKDSTVAAALLVRALGADRVIGVLMPNEYQEDIEDAQDICDYLGIKWYKINIGTAYAGIVKEFIETTDLEVNAAIETNTPARLRMTTLYMVAAAVGGRVCCTDNASESYVGYSTKYGDLAGDFAILKNFYVREVLEIGDALGLPKRWVHKTPSDGMCGRTDEDNLGFTYELLDAYLLNETLIDDFPTYQNIYTRHKQNMHKNCINLPAPSVTTRHWENDESWEVNDWEF